MTMHPRRSEAMLASFARDVRAGEWWTFKIVPILAIFYLTALREGGAIIARWPTLLLLLGGLAAGAAFVSLINDLCDITDDRVAGKPNRMAGRRRIVPILGIALCIAAGTVIGFQWRNDAVALTAFAAAWFAFLLYSAPPFRLKIRGGAGLLADAAGSSLFPCLLAARLAGASDLRWLLCVGIWALAFGIRGIVWHQLNDEDADRRANVRTFVVRRGRPAPSSWSTLPSCQPRPWLWPVSLSWGTLWQSRSPHWLMPRWSRSIANISGKPPRSLCLAIGPF